MNDYVGLAGPHSHIMVDDYAVAQISDLTLGVSHCITEGCGVVAIAPDRPIAERHMAPMLELATTLLNTYKNQAGVIRKTDELKDKL